MSSIVEQTLKDNNSSSKLYSHPHAEVSVGGKKLNLNQKALMKSGRYNYNFFRVFQKSEGTSNFGSNCLFRVRGPYTLKNMYLDLKCSQLSNGVDNANVGYVESFELYERIEVMVNDVIVETLYPSIEHMTYEIMTSDDDKPRNITHLFTDSAANRCTRNDNDDNVISIKIDTIIQRMGVYLPNLNRDAEFAIRIYFKPQAQVCMSNNDTTDPTVTDAAITSCELLCEFGEYNYSSKKKLLLTKPLHYRFNMPEIYKNAAVLSSGSSSISLPLKFLNGSFSHIMFYTTDSIQNYDASATTVTTQNKNTVEYTNSQFSSITDFHLLDHDNKRVMYNFDISTSFHKNKLLESQLEKYTKNTYMSSDMSNVRIMSWSDNIKASMNDFDMGSVKMSGNHTLNINYPTLTATKNLVVVAWRYRLVSLGVDKKLVIQ